MAIDLLTGKARSPNIEELLQRCHLRDKVEIFYEPTSYTWRLMKFMEERPRRVFDLCYLDGAHTWFVDGFAFLLVDHFLRPGGMIVFDDIDWTFDTSPTLKETELVARMPPEERQCAQVRKVFELLVASHPSYEALQIQDNWGFARKRDVAVVGDVKATIVTQPRLIGALERRAKRAIGRLWPFR